MKALMKAFIEMEHELLMARVKHQLHWPRKASKVV
jgi:hypothetical protein